MAGGCLRRAPHRQLRALLPCGCHLSSLVCRRGTCLRASSGGSMGLGPASACPLLTGPHFLSGPGWQVSVSPGGLAFCAEHPSSTPAAGLSLPAAGHPLGSPWGLSCVSGTSRQHVLADPGGTWQGPSWEQRRAGSVTQGAPQTPGRSPRPAGAVQPSAWFPPVTGHSPPALAFLVAALSSFSGSQTGAW